jgi:DNA-directed RNA polymerase subunit M/transcription elongation factor TFIIS
MSGRIDIFSQLSYPSLRDEETAVKCEQCVYRDGKNPEICKICPFYDPSKTVTPRRDLEKVDIFKMAKQLHDREIQGVKDEIPSLSDCPKCGEHSLYFDPTRNRFECLYRKCPLGGKSILQGSELFAQIALKLLKGKQKA